jgi:hypothetical protein
MASISSVRRALEIAFADAFTAEEGASGSSSTCPPLPRSTRGARGTLPHPLREGQPQWSGRARLAQPPLQHCRWSGP